MEWGHESLIQIMNAIVCISIRNNPVTAALLYFVTVPVIFMACVWQDDDSKDVYCAQSLASDSKSFTFRFFQKKRISYLLGIMNRFHMRNEIRMIELRDRDKNRIFIEIFSDSIEY